jgi:hypothetical protein
MSEFANMTGPEIVAELRHRVMFEGMMKAEAEAALEDEALRRLGDPDLGTPERAEQWRLKIERWDREHK